MADNDLRQFMHELLARFEKRSEAMQAALGAQTAAMHEQAVEMRAQAAAMHEQAAAMRAQAAAMRAIGAEAREGRTAIADMRAEIRAQTQGLLHVLDQLRGSEGSA